MEASGAGDMCDADDSATPDSTTRDKVLFTEGEDVFVRNKDGSDDGKFYLGTVVQLDLQSGCCLVKFLDDTEQWSPFHELTRLSTPENDLLCVVCKSSKSLSDNAVTACEKCSRGYHRLCHQPPIPLSAAGGSWQCQKCRKPERKKKDFSRKSGALARVAAAAVAATAATTATAVTIRNPVSTLRPPSPVTSATTVPTAKAVVPQCASSSRTVLELGADNGVCSERFPYDLNSLCWDLLHRTNEEDCYCYCGGPGLWFMQMLQCSHCRQWFHQNCVRCLHYPLYCGDRFYVFICSVCNKGCEFLRRFELKWVDVVHLALFNMTVYFAKKYFDLDGEILPYIHENAFSLQLPSQIVNCNLDAMRETIIQELANNEDRFKCGKEIKKRTTIWGLRHRVPPTAHVLTLPKTRPVTDAALREFWSDNPRLNYMPLSSARLMEQGNPPMVSHSDGVFGAFDWSVMKGPAMPEMQPSRFGRPTAPGLRLLHVEIPGVALPASPSRICIKSSDNIGHGGFVNKFVSHLAPNKLTLQQSLLRQKLHAMGIRPKRKHFFKRSKSLSLSDADKKGERRAATDRRAYSAEAATSTATASGTSTATEQAPKKDDASNDEQDDSQDEEQDDSQDDSQDETSQDDRKIPPGAIKLPPTPPSSVSAPGTPQPPSASPGDTSDSGGADSALPQSQTQSSSPPLSLTVAKLLGSPLSLPAESSASSTSALSEPLAAGPSDTFRSIAIPLHLSRLITQPPLRTVKRKLSEKDIRIDRNGDVKRRRLRRSRSGLRTVQLDSGELLETRLVGGKLLRSPLKTPTPSDMAAPAPADAAASVASASQPARIPTPPPPSPPSPPTVEVSLEAVKKSVSSYFGTMNRIASGEKFLIKGKRTSPCGRTQYLIEWKS